MSDSEPFWSRGARCRMHGLNLVGPHSWRFQLLRSVYVWLLATAGLFGCRVVVNAAATQPTLLWQVQGIAEGGNPTRGVDGTIYVGATNGLAAYSPGGSQLWVYPTGPGGIGVRSQSSVAVAADGSIAYSSDDTLLVLNPNGTLRWSFQAETKILSYPAFASDGTIYVGTQGTPNPATGYYLNGKLLAIRPDGSKAWEFTTANAISGSAAVARDGTIYFGSWDKTFYALNADGSLKWGFPTSGFFVSSPAIGVDGVIYAANLNTRLYALNTNGTQKWAIGTGDDAYWSPTVAPDGTVYGNGVVGGTQVAGAIYSDGVKKWTSSVASTFNRASSSSCSIAHDGSVIFVPLVPYGQTTNNYVLALYANGTSKWTLNLAGASTLQPLLAPDGTLYVCTQGSLMAFATDSGLANAPWPMFGRGPGRTGNALGAVGTAPSPPLIVSHPTPQIVLAGANVRLQANVVGSDSLGFQWWRDGVAITNATLPWLALPSVQRTNSGSYQLQVTNALGVTVSSNTLLRVQAQQSLTLAKVLGGGRFQFVSTDLTGTGIGTNDLAYIEVHASTNLLSWEILTNSAVLTNGQLLIEDPSTSLPSRRYYRVLQR